MDAAWLIPAICAGAFFVNVIYSRHMGGLRGFFGGFFSIFAILTCFFLFLGVFTDALAHLAPFGVADAGHGATTATTTSADHAAQHLLQDKVPWWDVGKYQLWLTMSVDWLSIMMLGVVSFLASLIQIYALGYMKGDNRFWWFFSVMSLFCAAMFTLVLAYDFLLL
ncbi:MAG TPA: hypothetical protein VFN74_22650, partial [Chloroflexota bacterium]|nr:hypothetical protein [Chloroflexota bacterium]